MEYLWLIPVVVIVLLVFLWRRAVCEADFLQETQAKDRAKWKKFLMKGQTERDLELSTTTQLMQEIADRVPGFIILQPQPTNKPDEVGIAVHIKGMTAERAVECLNAASYTIANNPPGQDEEWAD